MLYDRLLLDLGRAETAQQAANWPVASENLLHAQAIIAELVSSLKTDAWDGADGLLGLYNYAFTALVNANIQRDPALTREAIELLEPLRQAWHEAAAAVPAPAAARAPEPPQPSPPHAPAAFSGGRGLEHPARNRWRESRFWLIRLTRMPAWGEPVSTTPNQP